MRVHAEASRFAIPQPGHKALSASKTHFYTRTHTPPRGFIYLSELWLFLGGCETLIFYPRATPPGLRLRVRVFCVYILANEIHDDIDFIFYWANFHAIPWRLLPGFIWCDAGRIQRMAPAPAAYIHRQARRAHYPPIDCKWKIVLLGTNRVRVCAAATRPFIGCSAQLYFTMRRFVNYAFAMLIPFYMLPANWFLPQPSHRPRALLLLEWISFYNVGAWASLGKMAARLNFRLLKMYYVASGICIADGNFVDKKGHITG